MKYFTVELGTVKGRLEYQEVASDGTAIGMPDKTEVEMDIPIEFFVREYDEDNVEVGSKSYAIVITDSGMVNNSRTVLERIREEHPAPEWQNNEW